MGKSNRNLKYKRFGGDLIQNKFESKHILWLKYKCLWQEKKKKKPVNQRDNLMEIVFPFPGQSSWPEPWLAFTQTCWHKENCLLRWGSGPVITFYWDIDVAQIKQGWSCGCCRQEKRKRAKYDVFLHLQPIGMCFAGLMVIWTLNSHSFPFLSPMTRNNSSGLSVTPNPPCSVQCYTTGASKTIV